MFVGGRIALVASATLVVVPFSADATVTSTSTFERCINNEDCQPRLTMQVNLQSGANMGEEVLISQVSCPNPSDCNDHDAAQLNNTIKLSFYHTRPVLAYDLYYFADFNAAPKEVVVYGGKGENGETCSGPGHGMSLFEMPDGIEQDVDQCFGAWLGPTCHDGGRDEDVSCGWLYPQSYIADLQSGGTISGLEQLMSVPWQSAPLNPRTDRVANVVPDSQGFCCDCDAQGFLFENYDISRGNIQCNALDSNSPHASAHCMRMDKLWYSAYDIGQSRENYNIFINIQVCDDDGLNCETPPNMRPQYVGPERPRAVLRSPGTDDGIRIEWAPFGSADNALDLSSKMLLRPNCHGNPDCYTEYAQWSSFDGAFEHQAEENGPMLPGSHINDPERWLLIPRSDISMTGNDCNQIGLTYAGFRNQGDMKCVRPYDSCLDKIEVNGRLMSSARIKDYVEADMESAAQNSVGRFFPQFVYPGSALDVEKNGDDYAELKYEVDEYRVSQLTLIMTGSLVAVHEYEGELEMIDFGLSCMNDQFNPVDCFHNEAGSVEAASNDGLLAVTLRNVGDFTDLFTVGFPSEKFEIDNGDGTYTPMSGESNSDLSPIQARSTDQLPGRGGRTERCEAGTVFDARISQQATQCWDSCLEDGEDAGRRLQADVDPDARPLAPTCNPSVQCGGAVDPDFPHLTYPDLRDDCDTVGFQIHSNNGLDRRYCVHVEVTNQLGNMVFPQQKKKPGSEYSHLHRAFLGGSAGDEIDTTEDEQKDQGRVCFNTTKIEYVLVGDAEDAFAAGGEPLRVDPSMLDCSQFCPGTFDIVCMAGNDACSNSLFTALAVFVAIILLCVIAKKLRLGPFSKKKKVKIVTKTKTKVVTQEAPSGQTANPVAVASATGGAKHFCPNCGAEFAQETKFCASCGTHNDSIDMGKD